MVAIDLVAAASQTGTPNQGALTAGSYLRVVSATIVIYEYVARRVYLILVANYARPVILSHFLPNFGFTRQRIDVGKTSDAGIRGSPFVQHTPAE